MAYRAQQPARLAALEAARSITDVAERTKTLFLGRDKVGAFLRQTLGSTLLYAARVAPDIAYSIDDVDRAMKWGFGWELGPFEIWDAIGIREVIDALGSNGSAGSGGSGSRGSGVLAAEAVRVPPLAAARLQAGTDRFREGPVPPAGPELLILKAAKRSQPHREAQRRGEPRGPRRRRAARSSSTRR